MENKTCYWDDLLGFWPESYPSNLMDSTWVKLKFSRLLRYLKYFLIYSFFLFPFYAVFVFYVKTYVAYPRIV